MGSLDSPLMHTHIGIGARVQYHSPLVAASFGSAPLYTNCTCNSRLKRICQWNACSERTLSYLYEYRCHVKYCMPMCGARHANETANIETTPHLRIHITAYSEWGLNEAHIALQIAVFCLEICLPRRSFPKSSHTNRQMQCDRVRSADRMCSISTGPKININTFFFQFTLRIFVRRAVCCSDSLLFRDLAILSVRAAECN